MEFVSQRLAKGASRQVHQVDGPPAPADCNMVASDHFAYHLAVGTQQRRGFGAYYAYVDGRSQGQDERAV